MLQGLMLSAVTFRRDFREKVAFVLLNQLDILLTLIAMAFGLTELNPVMRSLMGAPGLMFLVKVIAPLGIAWLVPGKLLLPAVALLLCVVGWDIKELVIYLA